MQARGSDPTCWLALTKLQPPLPRADLIPRPELLASLREAMFSSRLTLVSAPAGFGKTTLLGAPSWGKDAPSLAWLSLDEEDADLARFLRAVVLALRRLYPGFGASVLSLVGDHTNPALNPYHVAAALVNDASETVTEAMVLVLDDLHLVSDPAVHAALDLLLERMPPLLHLAVGTRHDPPLALARLRARGQLAEIRADDIRFSPEEAAQLLNDRLGLALDHDDLALLYSQTEGWPVGLRLLSDSLARIPSMERRSEFLCHMERENRPLFDYFAAEVLDRQAPVVRRFLLETSILPDLTPGLCRAVTGRRDAAAILEDLDRRSLLVRAVEGLTSTFRYHPLFAAFLQARLRRDSPGKLPELHRRAALATANPARAIAHYTAAERWDAAAAVIEQIGGLLLKDGLATTVAGWLQMLPDTILASRPRLMVLDGICSFLKSDLAASRVRLEKALPALEVAGDEAGAAEALGYLATCLFWQLNFEGADAVTRAALARPLRPPQRVQLLMMRSFIAVHHLAPEEALASLDAAVAETEAAGTPEAYAALALNWRLDLAAVPGVIDRIERFLKGAGILLGGSATLPGVATLELMTFSHLWRGRLNDAIEAGERGLADIIRLGGHPYLGLQAAGFCAQACLTRGDHASVERLLNFVMERIAATPLGRHYVAAPLYVQGESYLTRGDVRGARRSRGALWAAATDQESTEASALRLKLRGHLSLVDGRYAEAERDLRQAVALEEKMPGARLFGRARVMLARLYYEQGRQEAALLELEPVLAECEQYDTPGVILLDGAIATPVLRLAFQRGLHATFAARVLSLVPPNSQPMHGLAAKAGGALSLREVQVLRLLATGARNRAIAERLQIEETTVKSHVSSIIHKLGVSSRTQAAMRARDPGFAGEERPANPTGP